MDDLFNIPDYDPVAMAKILEKEGELWRRDMKKGKGYMTTLHKAANLLRWYAKNNGSTVIAKQSVVIVRDAVDTAKALRRRLWIVSVLFAGYFIGSLTFFAWVFG